ncbi:MAG: LamG domain-containing protein [Dehalococcoidales bacterium]|nr:LamG domain-containing protein [Dehalococcoidales bacterium]
MGWDAYTKLVSHCDGDDEGTTFTDELGHTMTAHGHVNTETDQKQFGTASAQFDGAGDDYIDSPNDADWDFGTGDFTLDCWIYPTGWTTYPVILSTYPTGSYWGMQVYNNGADFAIFGDFPTVHVATGGISLNAWTHLAISRESGKIYFFKNGTLLNIGGTSFTQDLDADSDLLVGTYNKTASGHQWNGYIDEIRISKGIARWTSDFTPPTEPYAPPDSSPTVTTLTPDNVLRTVATLNGEINDTGGVNCTRRGFQYGTVSGALDQDVHEDGDFGSGTFSFDLSNLTHIEEYFVRAYATNIHGTTYGVELPFMTVVSGIFNPLLDYKLAFFGYTHDSILVNGNVHAIVRAHSNTIYIDTCTLNHLTGAISAAIDEKYVNGSYTTARPRIFKVNGSTYVVLWQSSTENPGIHITTCTISDTGTITLITTTSFAGSRVFDGYGQAIEVHDTGSAKLILATTTIVGTTQTSLLVLSISYDGTSITIFGSSEVATALNVGYSLRHVSGDIYALLRTDDSGNGPYLLTFSMVSGNYSYIDSGIIDPTVVVNFYTKPILHRISHNVWLAIYGNNTTGKTRLQTFELTDTGVIGSIIDTDETLLDNIGFTSVNSIHTLREQVFMIVVSGPTNHACSIFISSDGYILSTRYLDSLYIWGDDSGAGIHTNMISQHDSLRMFVSLRIDTTAGPNAYISTYGIGLLHQACGSNKKMMLMAGVI